MRKEEKHCKCGNLLGWESKSQDYDDCKWCRKEKQEKGTSK